MGHLNIKNTIYCKEDTWQNWLHVDILSTEYTQQSFTDSPRFFIVYVQHMWAILHDDDNDTQPQKI